MNRYTRGGLLQLLVILAFGVLLLYSCANRVSLGGGPYDEKPPVLVGSTPAPLSLGVKGKKVVLHFDEYIKIKEVSKKVIISPPQLQLPRIQAIGKRVVVELEDSLIPNTTYTLDFTDAIVDNNEDNPLENFSFAFSTGDQIDTMAFSGKVLDARTLEPIQNVLVGLHPDTMPLTAFRDTTFLRMSRTSDRALFVLRNVKNGSYRLFALQESDGNYRYDNPTDGIAFLDSTITTRAMAAVRQDTTWIDSLTIDTIRTVHYTRFFPDDLVMRFFVASSPRRFLTKRERNDSLRINMEFNEKIDSLITIRNVDSLHPSAPVDSAALPYVIDWGISPTGMSSGAPLTVFLLDSVWQRAEQFSITYPSVDSLQQPIMVTDTLTLRIPKSKAEPKKEMTKAPDNPSSASSPSDSLRPPAPPPPSPLRVTLERRGSGGRADSIFFTTTLPIDSTALKGISMAMVRDSVHHPLALQSVRLLEGSATRGLIQAPLEYDRQYEVTFDSLLFVDLYGHHLDKTQVETFQTQKKDEFSHFEVVIQGLSGPFIIELLSEQGAPLAAHWTDRSTTFVDLKPGKYYLRLVVDQNANGKWDTGSYDEGRQPEMVYYSPKEFELMKNWKLKENWSPLATPLQNQKPEKIIKNKPKDNRKRNLNKRREEELRRQRQGSRGDGGMDLEGGLGGIRGVLGR